MATSTTKLALRKPATVDDVNVITDLGDNFDKIDDAIGTTICTSSTRPASPFTGQRIHETDTKLGYMWDGSSWIIRDIPGFTTQYLDVTPSQNLTTAAANITSTSKDITTVRPDEGVRIEFSVYCSCATATANSNMTVKGQLDNSDSTLVSADAVWLVNTGSNGNRLTIAGFALFKPASAGLHTAKLVGSCQSSNNLFSVLEARMSIKSEYL
jgi:hypothetical protein